MKYKSCTWIERGIDFSKNSIKICCLCRPNFLGRTVIIEDYNGGPVDWEKVFAFKNKIKDLHKKGEIYYKCEGCVFLEEKEWPEYPNYIDTINIDHWSKCNSKCVYCYTTEDKKLYNSEKIYEILPIIKDMISKNILTKIDHANFGGGEVTILKEFEKLLDVFLSYCQGYTPIRIHSSGANYSKTIEKGLKSGFVDLVVSPDSATEKMHKKIKQVSTYKNVWKHLEQYAKAQIRGDLVKTKYIVLPEINDDETEIENFLIKSKKIGIETVIFEIEGRWLNINKRNLPDRICNLFHFAKNRAEELGLNFSLYDRATLMMDIKNKTVTY